MLEGDVVLHDGVLEGVEGQLLEGELVVSGHVTVLDFLLGEVEALAGEDVLEVSHGAEAPVGEEELACTQRALGAVGRATYLSL